MTEYICKGCTMLVDGPRRCAYCVAELRGESVYVWNDPDLTDPDAVPTRDRVAHCHIGDSPQGRRDWRAGAMSGAQGKYGGGMI